MYLDLDNFKHVNDKAGHAVGDLAIREIAARLKDVARGRDTLARLGGDEFWFVAGMLSRGAGAPACDATASGGGSLCPALGWRMVSAGHQHRPRPLQNPQSQSEYHPAAADAACYQPRRNGEGTPHIQLVKLDACVDG